jgi:hypothetical protein
MNPKQRAFAVSLRSWLYSAPCYRVPPRRLATTPPAGHCVSGKPVVCVLLLGAVSSFRLLN